MWEQAWGPASNPSAQVGGCGFATRTSVTPFAWFRLPVCAPPPPPPPWLSAALSGTSRTLHPAYCFQVLVPCKGSLPSSVQSTCQFESYILIPVEEHFQTLNGKVFISLWVNQGPSLSVWEWGWGAGGPASDPVPAVVNDGSNTHSSPWPGLGGPPAFEERGDGNGEQGLAGPLPGRRAGGGVGGWGISPLAQGPPAGKSGSLWNI